MFNRKIKVICVMAVATIFLACQSHEQKPDEAFEVVKQDKLTAAAMAILDTAEPVKPIHITTVISNTSTSVAKVNRTPALDEWSLFQLETEKKIEANKATIKAMRELPNAGDKLIKRITKLERDNNALMREMDEYKEDVKVRWENFKLTLNHDVNQIQIELKDLSVKNGR